MEQMRSPYVYGFVGLVLFGLASVFTNTWLPFLIFAAIACVGACVAYIVIRRQRRKNAEALVSAIAGDDEKGVSSLPATDGRAAQVDLQQRLKNAVRTVRDSRLGEARGNTALYDLPWYLLIGHSAAGKSSAVKRAGLRFPIGEEHGCAVAGDNGTRDCDWYFTAEGILLDTAGRYTQSRNNQDQKQWHRFLDMLRKYRPRAPINGVIVTASLNNIRRQASDPATPDALERHAADLRQRIHEVTERLQIKVPVYVVFTMADQIGGFTDFFSSLDADERSRVWGATLPFEAAGTAIPATLFSTHFEHLVSGLRSYARARMSQTPENIPGAMLAMPQEFASLEPVLIRFIDTLFEDNPFQFRSPFRGFYFTSAEQQGTAVSHLTESIATRFSLEIGRGSASSGDVAQDGSCPSADNKGRAYFLQGLFRQVVFADAKLVRQVRTRSRRRRQTGLAVTGCVAIGLVLAVFASAYRANQQLIRNVAADFEEVGRVQADHVDLKSRLDAMLVLQDRLQQLIAYRESAPLTFWPLYSGDKVLVAVRREYFAGMRQLMVMPVNEAMENYLIQVAGRGGTSENASKAPAALPDKSPYQATSASDKGEAYKTLKAYLMLADAHRAEPAHLAAQLTRFWRQWLEEHRGSMSREDLVERAEKLLSLYVTLAAEPDWPSIQPRAALVDDTRRILAEAMQGVPARDRVFTEIISRASARYPATTVRGIVGGTGDPVLTGSYAIPGAYSVAAWEGYVKQAISDASRKALDTSDWVLQDTHVDDLTLSGTIGSQSLRYRNEPPQWSNFGWGGTSAAQIVIIEATSNDGHVVRIADFRGADALGELVRTAERQRANDGTHILSWSRDGMKVSMRLKIVSTAHVDADGARKRGLRGVQLPAMVAGKAGSGAMAGGTP